MFTNQVVVITGASRGIGHAIAEAFADHNARLVLIAAHREPLEAVADDIIASGNDVLALQADISSAEEVEKIRKVIMEDYRQVDILINNAGVAIRKPFVESTFDEWAHMINVNQYGMYYLTHALLPLMIERKHGTIINMAAAVGRKGYPGLAIYSATKAAVIAYTEALAKEIRRYGLTAYSICPHGVDTDLYHGLFGDADADKLIEPQAVAREILQVASGKNNLTSGQTIEIALTMARHR